MNKMGGEREIMTRTDFIDILQKTLAGSLGSSYVNENVRFYQEYIDTQIRSGISEEETIEKLGDPRLIAKTIIEAAKQEHSSYVNAQEYDQVYEEGEESQGGNNPKVYHMPGWLLAVVIILIIVVVLGIVGSLLSVLLPIIIPITCVVLMVRFFQNQSRK